MSFLIIIPTSAEKGYLHAARTIQNIYKEITLREIAVSEHDDGISDLFVIGSDAVNDFVTILEAAVLGGNALASEWGFAIIFPNIFRRLLGEGALENSS